MTRRPGAMTSREDRIADPRVVDHQEAKADMPVPLRFLTAWLGLRQYVLVRAVSA